MTQSLSQSIDILERPRFHGKLIPSPLFAAPLLFSQVRSIWMVIVGRKTGRRKFEIMTIVLSSLHYEMTEDDQSGKKLRTLEFCYLFQKGSGPGVYQQKMMGGVSIDECPVAWTLLLLQHLGGCGNALDVYQGREKLNVDSQLFGNVADLKSKLEIANRKVKAKLTQIVTSRNRHSSDTEDTMDSVESDLWSEFIKTDNFPITAMAKVHEQARRVMSVPMKIDAAKKIPGNVRALFCFLSFCHQISNVALQIMRRYGYLSSPDKWLGIQNQRRDYQQDTKIAAQLPAFDSRMHQDVNSGHTASVARSSYINDNAVKSSVPANLLSRGNDPDLAKMALDIGEHPPLYSIPGRFLDNWEVRDASPPGIEDFLRQNGVSPPFFRGCCCMVDDCKEIFTFQSDLRDHLSDRHGGRSTDDKISTTCPTCFKSMPLKTFLRSLCCQDPGTNPLVNSTERTSAKKDGPPPAVVVYFCGICNPKWFSCTPEELTRHSKTKHKYWNIPRT